MTSSNIHNYYEKLVLDHILDVTGTKGINAYVEDVACIALNQITPRYVRFDIDMAFYLSPAERKSIGMQVDKAVSYALKYLNLKQRTA